MSNTLKIDVHTPLDERISDIGATIADAQERSAFFDTLARLDRDRYQSARRKHDVAGMFDKRPASAAKYFDVAFWLRSRLWLAKQLALFDAPPKRILDIGPGIGDFAALCTTLGHEVCTIDSDKPPEYNLIYSDMCAAFGVERIISPVKRLRPMPDIGRFDLVTAIGTKFEKYELSLPERLLQASMNFIRSNKASTTRRNWTLRDWSYFLENLSGNCLFPGSAIFLLPNMMLSRGGEPVRDIVLMNACQAAGAVVDRTRWSIHFERVESPIVLCDPA